MLSFLETIANAILFIGEWIIWSVVSFWNLLMEGIGVVVTAAFLILPSIGNPPKIASATLEEINWFFPFTSLAAVVVTMLVTYGIWLISRWLLRLVRAA
jgi:hypothetical protein